VSDLHAIANTLGGLSAIGQPVVVAARGGKLTTQDVLAALDEFSECVRYLNTRRNAGAVLSLNQEADVQDAIYLILRPWIPDLIAETPTDRVGNRYSIRDFLSKSLRLVVEAKYVRDKDHGRAISKEMHDDIEVYRHNPFCDTILFFVYDPDSFIPDQRELRRTIEQSRVYDGKPLACKLIVKP